MISPVPAVYSARKLQRRASLQAKAIVGEIYEISWFKSVNSSDDLGQEEKYLT